MLVGLSGLSRSGKDTVARILQDKHGYTWRSFAANLRFVLSAINPYLEGGIRYKDALKKYGLDELKRRHPEAVDYMISLGQSVRDVVHEDSWTWGPLMDVPENLVISDCRQPNEADKILALGGQLWKINRPVVSQKRGMDGLLEHYDFDVVIYNTGTIADLEKIVETIIDGR